MNKLIIIGNGFDLAHGLKTRYSDFIIWYLNKIISQISQGVNYNDLLVTASSSYIFKYSEFQLLIEFQEYFKNYPSINIQYHHPFFKDLLSNCFQKNWVDIESMYYKSLINIYKQVEEYKNIDLQDIEKEAVSLNKCFEAIKEELVKYLIEVELKINCFDEEVNVHLERIITENHTNTDTIYFLVFNYTSTVEQYIGSLSKENSKIIVNYIHGKLMAREKPIVFGYGDEVDVYYQRIESLQINEFLRHFKSFSYFKTQVYQHLTSFIESDIYKVYIIGHSCGTTDRILLSSIFENSNCQKIEILYHEKEESVNDFAEKTIEISRHFRSEQKQKMRKVIVPEILCNPLKKMASQ